ncbi:hypothetical protein KAFR_0A08650 [Kazachstania africana CBS 2517]|uniref:RRM domain-containing protein n=1 Tax=Kazachstania africana (strain ATCC 22294 / BCRC 22015 / CBS 2517 / CECT 1963 / NBRC 1671 / NRRL Y-8276) TaxID=1071382 RepID=H2APJ9_KAZAF|nr:hypothetical protein KAFR_0A08650 [Kazachstania africana CBS 2517]CCF56299.1 hypothetical protein KAFR_0A08650 [Kazachstania africana CBS 2517]
MGSIAKRIFVGNLNENLDDSLAFLHSRFQKFGSCKDDSFEKHSNFAYLNMSFNDEKDFQKLKSTFNNMKFKGNQLKIDLAKPSWESNWESQLEKDKVENEKKQKFIEQKNWEFYKKMKNINMSWTDRRQVLSGRIRKTPRRKFHLKSMTFRVNVNGSLKVYKCYKTKLWGYEKNKELMDLVYKFVGGKWRNGYDHIVDRLDYSRSVNSIKFPNKENKNSTLTISNEGTNIEDEEHLSEEEKQKNNDVLTDLLSRFDFDKSVAVVDSDEAEAFGFSDHEEDTVGMNEQKSYLEAQNVSTTHQEYNMQDDAKDEEGGEDEPMPTFGFSNAETTQIKESTTSNTETLRSLFNPEQIDTTAASFKLMDEKNDDIDESKTIPETQIADIMEREPEAIRENNPESKNHLFFPHFNSPFLVGQTQLSKIKRTNNNILDNWEDEFWENRGIWMKEMKNKKRDALRQIRKRKAKDNNVILI